MERRVISKDDNSSTSLKVAENAFAQVVRIKDVEDQSNYPFEPNRTPAWKSGKKAQLLLKVTYEKDGREGNMLLMGKFEVANGAIKEWNTWNNAVHIFLGVIYGQYELEHDWSIPFDVIQGCIGKDIMVIRYMTDQSYEAKDGSSKPSWNTWDVVFEATATIDQMKQKFSASVEYLLTRGYAPHRKVKKKETQESEVNQDSEPDESEYDPNAEPVI